MQRCLRRVQERGKRPLGHLLGTLPKPLRQVGMDCCQGFAVDGDQRIERECQAVRTINYPQPL